MDFERDEERHRLRLSWTGFALCSAGLGLLCASSAVHLAFRLTLDPDISNLIQSSWWEWLVGAPITWCTLIGSMFLLGRSNDPSWRQRAGLLMIMNFIDTLVWTVDHAEQLGLQIGDLKQHGWLRYQLGAGLSWPEFMLFASLAAEEAMRLGKEDAGEASLGARSLATIGASLWAIMFVAFTDFHRWPLQARFGPGMLLALLGSILLATIVSFQVTLLSIIACRKSSQALASMAEADQDHELLRSRSESLDDAPHHWFNDDDPWR